MGLSLRKQNRPKRKVHNYSFLTMFNLENLVKSLQLLVAMKKKYESFTEIKPMSSRNACQVLMYSNHQALHHLYVQSAGQVSNIN